jgi:hypothetical protein
MMKEDSLGLTPTEKKLKEARVSVRAEYILGELQGKTREEARTLLKEYAQKKILTKDVLKKMSELKDQ